MDKLGSGQCLLHEMYDVGLLAGVFSLLLDQLDGVALSVLGL